MTNNIYVANQMISLNGDLFNHYIQSNLDGARLGLFTGVFITIVSIVLFILGNRKLPEDSTYEESEKPMLFLILGGCAFAIGGSICLINLCNMWDLINYPDVMFVSHFFRH